MTNIDEELLELDSKRKALEEREKELRAYLTLPGMPGMKESLNTPDGYPRADIDLINIVQARHDLACLNTDYDAIMKQIEQKLAQRSQSA